jgi:hypothetical protein
VFSFGFDAAPMQKPLEYGLVGDEAALRRGRRCELCG